MRAIGKRLGKLEGRFGLVRGHVVSGVTKWTPRYTGGMVVHTLVPCEVSSRDLQLIGSAVNFGKRQTTSQDHLIERSQDCRILVAIETRIPDAQLREKLEMSCREAEVLLLALEAYSNTFRSGTKHQSLLQELHHLAVHLADCMEGHEAKVVEHAVTHKWSQQFNSITYPPHR